MKMGLKVAREQKNIAYLTPKLHLSLSLTHSHTHTLSLSHAHSPSLPLNTTATLTYEYINTLQLHSLLPPLTEFLPRHLVYYQFKSNHHPSQLDQPWHMSARPVAPQSSSSAPGPRLSTAPSSIKPRQLSHLHAQLAQLNAHLADLENLVRMTSVQAECMRGLGGWHGGM
jgi:hypothetical protein